jgi:hypothetical protein
VSNIKSFRSPGVSIDRHVVREGPSPYFVAWKPHTSRMFYERKELMRWLKWPKGTDTRLKIDEWLDSFVEEAAPSLDMAAIKREGFGPEAHALDESDPNHQTKMVT